VTTFTTGFYIFLVAKESWSRTLLHPHNLSVVCRSSQRNREYAGKSPRFVLVCDRQVDHACDPQQAYLKEGGGKLGVDLHTRV
jgi:hypothetical protein